MSNEYVRNPEDKSGEIYTDIWEDHNPKYLPYHIRWNYKGDVWVGGIQDWGIGYFEIERFGDAERLIELLQSQKRGHDTLSKGE